MSAYQFNWGRRRTLVWHVELGFYRQSAKRNDSGSFSSGYRYSSKRKLQGQRLKRKRHMSKHCVPTKGSVLGFTRNPELPRSICRTNNLISMLLGWVISSVRRFSSIASWIYKHSSKS